MADDIGLIGKTALEAVKQQFLNLIANVVDDNQVTFTLDAVNSTLVIDSREIALDGSSGAFVNSFTIPYQKSDIKECLPYPLFVDISYPANFSQIRSYLRDAYGVVIEERELATSPTGSGLADSDFVTAPATVDNLLELYVTPTSGRFLAGGMVRFKVARADGARAISDVFQQTTRPSVLELTDNLNPQTSKTIFDATDDEIAREMLKNHFGFEVNEGAITLLPKSLDYSSSTVVISPNPNDIVYKGRGEFVFDKAPISSVLADVLTVNTDYPTSFKNLRSYLKNTYGFDLAERCFTATDPNQDGFREGDVIDVPLSPDGYLELLVTRNSVRWMGRDSLKLQFMKMHPDNPLTILALDSPDGVEGELYTRQTVVTGATGTVEYAVVRGTPPVPLDVTTGLYEGIPVQGVYTWTVKAKDSDGKLALRTETIRIVEQSLEAKIQTLMNRHSEFLEVNTGQTNNSQQDFYLINPEGIVANNRHHIADTMQEAQPNGDATTEGQSLYILGWLYRYLDTRDEAMLDKAKAAFDAYVNVFYDGQQPPSTPERWVCNWIVNGKEPVLSNWPLDSQSPTHSGFKGAALNFVNGFAQIPHNVPYWGQYVDKVTFAFEGALVWDSIVSSVVGANPDGSPAWGEDGTTYDIEWMIAWNGYKYSADGDIISTGHPPNEIGQIQLKDHSVTKELKVNFANRQPVEHGGRLIGRNEAQHNRPCHVPVSRAYFGNASDAEQWFCDAAWLLWKETGEQRYYDAFRASLVTILEYTNIDAQDMFFRQTTKADTPFTDGISYNYTYPSDTPITFSRDTDGYINARTEGGVQLFMEQNSIWFRLGNESLIRSSYGGLDDEGKPFAVRLTMELSEDKNSTDARQWGMMLPSSTASVQSYDIPLDSMVPLTKEDGETPYILANTSDVNEWGGTIVEARFEEGVLSGRTASVLHFTIPDDDAQFEVSFSRYGNGRVPLDSLVYRASHDFNLRIIDDDGWRWWWMLEATGGQWATKSFSKSEARLSSYQPGHGSEEPRPDEPVYDTIADATILLDDSYTDAEFSYYVFNEIPPTYEGGDAYSILYTLMLATENAADIKIGDCTIINPRLDSLAYCPGVIPFSNNYLPDAEQFDGWHGMPYPGYQHPFFYVYADQLTEEEKSVRINNVVDFLYDSQVWYHDTFGIWGPGASAYIWNRWDNIKYGPADTWTMYHWGDGKAWAGYQPRAFFSAVRLIEAMQDVGMEVPERLTTYVTRWLTYLEEFVRQSGISPTDFPMQSIPVPDEDDFTGHMCGLWLAGASLAKTLGITVEGQDELCHSLFLELQRNQVWRPGVADVMNGGWSPWADPANNGRSGMAFGFWTGEILRGLSLYSLSLRD